MTTHTAGSLYRALINQMVDTWNLGVETKISDIAKREYDAQLEVLGWMAQEIWGASPDNQQGRVEGDLATEVGKRRTGIAQAKREREKTDGRKWL